MRAIAMRRTRQEEFFAVAPGFLSALYHAAHRLTGNEHDAEDLVAAIVGYDVAEVALLRAIGGVTVEALQQDVGRRPVTGGPAPRRADGRAGGVVRRPVDGETR
jgi:hypothetical protein